MADLSLNLNPSIVGTLPYRDLLIVNNDLCLTSDSNPLGTNNVLQDILQNLNFFLGEWFMNNTYGVPWFQQILVKNPDQAKVEGLLMNTILGTPGVQQLLSYSFKVIRATRLLQCSFSVMTTSGVVNYSGTVGAQSTIQT